MPQPRASRRPAAVVTPPTTNLLAPWQALDLPNAEDDGELTRTAATQLLKRCEQTISDNLGGFLAVGAALRAIKARKLHFHAGFDNFGDYVRERWDFGQSRAHQLIDASKVVEKFYNCGTLEILPANEAQVRPLLKLSDPDEQMKAWRKAVRAARNKPLTAKLVEEQVEQLADESVPQTKFNYANDNIDWAKWSWNPVTGCEMGCEYCYAATQANRFQKLFPKNFEPDFHAARLSAPANTKIPTGREKEPGIRNVFTCSMGELFGDWVRQEWIDKVLDVVREAPQWNFLFLTKNPKRLVEIDWPKNAWVGTTVDKQSRVRPAIAAMKQVKATVRYLSCEPLLEELTFPTMECFE